jgi:hypothetical protein
MNWNVKGILLLVACVLAWPAYAQHQSPFADRWAKGRLMLTDGDTLKSTINYNPTTDLLQINQNNTIKTFSAQKINSFDFFDPDLKRVRYYTALPYSANSDYKPLVFFETLLNGPHMALLARETIVTESVPMYDGFSNRTFLGSRTRVANQFYFMDQRTGKIKKYNASRKELLAALKDKQGPVKEFIKENKLRYNDTDDLIKIVDYYNHLKSNK